eukprot:TRINITY_DN184_c0_g1::TRINITY_DN184_c0_g1_i1::g.14373::m.14373 TRINITY_DN184_c0_g1::TRINITY_DN184_c0_g1_i1::g.14373  ORF type:complete len:607 (-),score=125.23,sp/Q9PKX5/TLC1_CHLMU/54.51/3e-172,TLC/PF03219.9/4.2e-180,B12D/PF06522.6/0.68,B12D/PF06522.6/1.2e+04,B12D/PF06522.6/3.4e+03 TRINITY_DN184_c0_g1_i1:35-1798(-)
MERGKGAFIGSFSSFSSPKVSQNDNLCKRSSSRTIGGTSSKALHNLSPLAAFEKASALTFSALSNDLRVSTIEKTDSSNATPRVSASVPNKANTTSSSVQAGINWGKAIPMIIMFFAILFNYTLLRDTKDVLIITAPGSGAEVIPFLKTWGVVPAAILFVIGYTRAADFMSKSALFYGTVIPFLIFYAAFPFLLYPYRDILHPHETAAYLRSILPAGMTGPIAIFENWTFSLYYIFAELWGSVVLSLCFWGFANEVTKVDEAKALYPLFGVFANVALIVAGYVLRVLSQMRDTATPGADLWGQTLKYLAGIIVFAGLILCGGYQWAKSNAARDPVSATKATPTPAHKKKPKMSFSDSLKILATSSHLRNLAVLVISYGLCINLVEISWKSQLKLAYPNPNDYSAFMGDFSAVTGAATLVMMVLGRWVLSRFGWLVAAQLTPIVLLLTGGVFFALTLFQKSFAPLTATLGVTPLMLAVWVGAAQNILSKATKYSLFDPTKEMAYIPLSSDLKTKGKAAIDVVASRLGKSGGSLIQQILLVWLGSLAAATPFLSGAFFLMVLYWMAAVGQLNHQLETLLQEEPEETTDA